MTQEAYGVTEPIILPISRISLTLRNKDDVMLLCSVIFSSSKFRSFMGELFWQSEVISVDGQWLLELEYVSDDNCCAVADNWQS